MGSNRISPTPFPPPLPLNPPLGSLSRVRSKRSLICIPLLRAITFEFKKKEEKETRARTQLFLSILRASSSIRQKAFTRPPFIYPDLSIIIIIIISATDRFRISFLRFDSRVHPLFEIGDLSSSWNRAPLTGPVMGQGRRAHLSRTGRAHLEEVVVSQVNVVGDLDIFFFFFFLLAR